MKNILRDIYWKMVVRARWLLPYPRANAVEVGRRIPDFTLRDLRGNAVTLSKTFPDKAAVLWLTNLCSGCEEKIPSLQKIHETHGDRLAIFAVSTLGQDRATPERILRKHRMTFPLLMDPEDWVANKLKLDHPAGACPLYNLLILDRTGTVKVRHHLSAIGDERLVHLLREL